MIPELHRDLAVEPAKAVLVVEDDPALRALLIRSLKENGFEVHSAGSGVQMAAVLADTPVDLVLLDVMLPGPNGFDLCRDIRRVSEVPIIMLSARGDESDRLVGLELGADDYMSKPFDPKELALRVDAILRRTGGKPLTPREIKLGPASFDMERLELTRDGAPMRLTEAEAQLLKTLAIHAHSPVERMDLSPDTADITGRAVDVQVTRLRRKLEVDPKNPRYLQTVRGVGYMLAPD